ncbi:protein outspread isoform X1 [Schistocerca gregaria]|uniref:protein outspread isoform X1 n=1 Tax=Schistocerca gregaria TaxID=7010 RepID=UPI00211E6815|nr:protein outspread isoform X1 [Schistocerca gregaria]
MSTALMRPECKQFAPNIFNKSKCANCFRQKEEHSAEALESNRATRTIVKCGYLFVAPGWDFSNPLNRTKRWQRRWFVLYDDGELSYSVDEHPDTVPQASIDMNKVLEVADAEKVTGNAFSLAITAPDGVHFVKGTSREECRWWADGLSVYPRSKGRHKRNATFPGGQSSSILPPTQSVRATTPSDTRPRFNSCHTEPLRQPPPAPQRKWTTSEADVIPTRDVTSPKSTIIPSELHASPTTETTKGYGDKPVSSASPPTRDKIQTEEKSRTRRVVNREKRGVKSARSFSEDFSGVPGILPSWRERKMASADIQDKTDSSRRILFDNYDSESKRDEKLKDIADSITRVRYKRNAPIASSLYLHKASSLKPTRDGECSEEEQQLKDQTKKPFINPALRGMTEADTRDDKLLREKSNVRGDPDGCGLDLSSQRYSPNSELRVDLPAEELLNIKKGWLMKLGTNKEWNKHWFVLRGAALMYYRDPTAEDNGILDGVIDLNGVSNVIEVQVARNYGFQIDTWDSKQCVLSAVTSGIRANWMVALRRAAGLKDPVVDGVIVTDAKLDSDLGGNQLSCRPLLACAEPSIVPSTPATPRSVLLSSDEEYRTASEGGRRESEDWGESLTPLPPSPPLNRTPISRVKEKARSRSNSRSRVYKRSRSSPPSSRHSTLDSIRPEDLLACCGELPESDAEESIGVDSVKSSLFDSAESQSTEVEDLKRRLSIALCDVSIAEKELLKLRQNKVEIAALENKVKDLMSSLEKTEHQLEVRTREAEELERLKESYKQLLEEHEQLLLRWRQQAVGPDWRSLYEQISDRYSRDGEIWQQKLKHAEAALQESENRCTHLERTVAMARENSRHSSTVTSPSREMRRSFGSLSDLTNIDLRRDLSSLDKDRVLEECDELRARFEKAVQEIKAMKRELRESHALYDDLELICIALRQDAKNREENERAQAALMVSRIEDLTSKLTSAEKQVRSLKQKLSKSDSREKRRSLSLKGRESFQICKELEEKLGELEAKINALEAGRPFTDIPKSVRVSRSESPQLTQKELGSNENLKSSSARLRRKSLDSATSSEPMKVLIRLSALESKVAKATESLASETDDVDMTTQSSSPEHPEHSGLPVEVSVEQAESDRCSEAEVRLHALDAMIAKSREKVQQCLNIMQTYRESVDHSSVLDYFLSLECRLSEIKDILQQCNTQYCESETDRVFDSEEVQIIGDSVNLVVSQLENVLRQKLSTLFEKRKCLYANNQLDYKASLNLLAEKLAYETVIISRVLQAVLKSKEKFLDFRKWVVDSEILESSRLISALKLKLSGTNNSGYKSSQSSLEHLTKILSERLLVQGTLALSDAVQSKIVKDTVCSGTQDTHIINILLQKQNDLSMCVRKYKEEKIDELAQSLAYETLSHTDEIVEANNCKLEDKKLREAWTVAQETVNHELIQAEISHVAMRCSQAYESSLTAERQASFTFIGTQRSFLEQWTETVEEILRKEMEMGIEELTKKYEEYIIRLKQNKDTIKNLNHSQSTKDSRKLLAELADVIANKALIDARISVILQEKSSSVVDRSPLPQQLENSVTDSNVVHLLDNEPILARLLDDETSEINVKLGTEFEFLFHKFYSECQGLLDSGSSDKPNYLTGQKGNKESAQEVLKDLYYLEKDLEVLRNHLTSQEMLCSAEIDAGYQHLTDVEDCDMEVTWHSVCSKCSALREQVANLNRYMLHEHQCSKCMELQEQMKRLEEIHQESVSLLRKSHQQEMEALKAELEQQQQALIAQHEHEQTQLKERARRLERRLGTLDSEYTQQVENLRAAYQKTLAEGLERDIEGEENIRQRYQAEIEHLRALCEKGLVAMENSHRRIIAELEEKHRQELEQLRLEKEQALAEETQATLAALDAMRKAHETEVQKEIGKFKSEFIKKMQSTHDIGALHKEHEAEMEEIKKEILSLSEKYSIKCVESAALEEQLSVANKQLAEAQQHILQLDARNKQLRAHLMSEANEISSEDAAELLEHQESRLQEKCAEIQKLQQQLNVAHAHGEELSALCSRLRDECGGCHGDGAVLTALWNRLQQLATAWPPHEKASEVGVSNRHDTDGDKNQEGQCSISKQHKEPPALAPAELMRCPDNSCSRDLQQSFLWFVPLHSPSPCPLGGMVAERKKLFEH